MRSRTFATAILIAASGIPLQARAQGAVKLTPALGRPTAPVAVSGSGFGAGEAVDVYVDTADTSLLVSTTSGTFSASVSIPSAAQPGPHYITAIGRHSGNAAQSPFTVTTPWLEQGFGAAHLGWNPYENTINTSNVGSLGTLWQISANGFGGAAAVGGGRVFLGTGSGLEAVLASTGSLLWKALPTGIFYATPAVVGPALYIGDGANSFMYAVSPANGTKIWTQATGGAFQSSAVVVGGLVYAGCVDDKVYAFSAATGKIVWTYTTGGFIDSSPAVVNGVLYIGSGDGSVYALNAATGALIWSYKTGNSVESSPAVSNGVVYVGSDDENLYAIAATGPNIGSALWKYTTGGAVYSAPAVAGGLVYFGSTDGNLYAVNAHSGALQFTVGSAGVVESPIVANGVVYVTSRSGSLLAVDANYGEVLATAVAGYTFLGNPTISDGVLYLNTFGYSTFAFSLLAGTNALRAHVHAPLPASLHPDMRLIATH